MFILKITTLILLVHSVAFAFDFGLKAVECTALLKSAQNATVLSPDATKSTLDAYLNLHDFNRTLLGGTEINARIHSDPFAQVLATSADAESEAVNARLMGLEAQWNSEQLELSEVPKMLSFGSVGVGGDASRFFNDTEIVRDRFERQLKRNLIHNLNRLKLWLLAQVDFGKTKKLEAFAKVMNERKNGAWAFRGETYFVSQDFVDWLGQKNLGLNLPPPPGNFKLLSKADLNPRDRAYVQKIEDAASDATLRDPNAVEEFLTVDHALVSPKAKNFRILYLDQLLRMRVGDDGTVQPELSIFVRIAKEKAILVFKTESQGSLQTLVPVYETNPARK